MKPIPIHPLSSLAGAGALGATLCVLGWLPPATSGPPILRELVQHGSVVYLEDGEGGLVKTIRLSGVNLQIVSGTGATNGNPAQPGSVAEGVAAVNGLGNLIVGYNELGHPEGDLRTGSHNLIVGTAHAYSSYGGIAAGRENRIEGAYSSVTAGRRGTAGGNYSGVSGGQENLASDEYAAVAGGLANQATNRWSSVAGGRANLASEPWAAILGGFLNTASGSYATVSGGYRNAASGLKSSILGGHFNEATGSLSTVAGGQLNTADGKYSSVGGGQSRVVSETSESGALDYDWVAGSLWEDE